VTPDDTAPDTDRITACRARLDGLAARSYAEQAAALEHVHEALTAELEDLRRRDRERGRAGR
jgi:hypothetical protein